MRLAKLRAAWTGRATPVRRQPRPVRGQPDPGPVVAPPPPVGPRARRRIWPWVHSTIRVTRDRWQNWSRELSSRPRRLYCDDAGGPYRSPRTLHDLQAIVRAARAEGCSVRVFGSSHSWAALVPNDTGYLVDNRWIGAPEGVYEMRIEPATQTRKARVAVPPGMLSSEVEHWLWEQGYSMPASAFEDCFTMAGMAATATHGAGIDIGSVSDMVVGMTFVDGLGRVRSWSREHSSVDELAAIQCGLGCTGLIYELLIEVEPRYECFHEARLIRYEDYFSDTDEARANLRDLHENHTSVEFFWWPFRFAGLPLLSKPELNPDVWILTTRRTIPDGARPRGWLRRMLHLKLFDLVPMVLCGAVLRAVRTRPRFASLLTYLCAFTSLWVRVRSGAWTLPQYDANHFVNASGVELLTAMAIEWLVPFERSAPLHAPQGYERMRASFATLHDLVVDAFERYPADDPRASPIVTAVEMRSLTASGALMSPCYQPESRRSEVRYAAPEIVTSAGHPAWEDFAEKANRAMMADALAS